MLTKRSRQIKSAVPCPGSQLRHFLLSVAFLALLSCSSAKIRSQAVVAELPAPGSPEGAWQDEEDRDSLLEISRTHLKASSGGQVQEVAKVLAWEEGRARVCQNGTEGVRVLMASAERLTLRDPGTGLERRFRRLAARPSSLDLSALNLPRSSPLPEEQIREIQAELTERMRADQRAVVDTRSAADTRVPRAAPWGSEEDLERLAVHSANTRYLKDLVSRVGWIDVTRFGYSTSNAAFLLVQHSGDLPLMMAALDSLRRDLEEGHPVGEAYALLFDRLQLRLGERQRYGTQIGRDPFGQPLVLPTEDPEKVAALREGLGIFPLIQAVRFFGGAEVRFSSECDAASGAAPHP